MRYTPGPWKALYFENYEYGDKEIVYRVIPIMRPGDNLISNEANARLIAASPQLLEACKEAVKKCAFPVGTLKVKAALEAAIAAAEEE